MALQATPTVRRSGSSQKGGSVAAIFGSGRKEMTTSEKTEKSQNQPKDGEQEKRGTKRGVDGMKNPPIEASEKRIKVNPLIANQPYVPSPFLPHPDLLFRAHRLSHAQLTPAWPRDPAHRPSQHISAKPTSSDRAVSSVRVLKLARALGAVFCGGRRGVERRRWRGLLLRLRMRTFGSCRLLLRVRRM